MINSPFTKDKRLFSDKFPMWLAILGFTLFTSYAVGEEVDTEDVQSDEDEVAEETDEEESETGSEDVDETIDEEVVEAETDPVEGDVDQNNMETVIATGSRLPGGDPTAILMTYDSEEIRSTGATTLDEFFRTIPHQFSSTNPQTSHNFNSGDQLGGDSGGIYNAFDLATVNLAGLGSSNTLVLLDGRRVAGYGGSERDIVNILGIPIEAIDSVQIQLGGGSAVYGADAIAGVVNFITKKDYQGFSANFKQENSTTGSDSITGGTTIGFGWNDLRATITLSTTESEPILNAKTGHTTLDFRDLAGPEFDYRDYNRSQPGIVREWNGSALYPGPYYFDYYINGSFNIDWDKRNFIAQLPGDHSGLNATVEDFNVGLENIVPYDFISHENGAHSENEALNIRSTYNLTQNIQLYFDGLFSESSSNQKFHNVFSIAMNIVVPASNAYNPFGRPMFVAYVPGREQSNGILPTPYANLKTDNQTGTLGVIWKFGDQEFELSVRESRTGTNRENFQVTTRRDRYEPGTEEFFRRLSSPDPDVAFNLFGNGTHGGAPFADFLGRSSRSIGENRTTTTQLNLKGYLFEIQGKQVSYSIGASRRAIRYNNKYLYFWGGLVREFDYNLIWNGTSEPVQRNESIYGEVWIPIFGGEKAGWYGEELQFVLKNIRSVDSSWGPVGGFNFDFSMQDVEVWDPGTGDWIEVPGYNYEYGIDRDVAQFINYKKGDNAPSIGLHYLPVEDVTIKVNYSRNIQPPLISELYDSLEGGDWFIRDVLDPYDPRGPTLHDVVPYRYTYANPNLKASIAKNYSVRIVWVPEYLKGFQADVTYTHYSIRGSIERGFSYRNEPTALRYPEIAVRNEEGILESIVYDYFNAHERRNVTADLLLSYRFGTPWLGTIQTRFNYNAILENYNEPFEGLVFNRRGTARDPDRYRSTVQIFWDKNQWAGTVTARYTPGYLNEFAHYCTFLQKLNKVGRCAQFGVWEFPSYISLDVASLTIVDATFRYTFENKMQLSFGGRNIFNRGAPLTILNRLPYDASRWDARGRVLSLGLQKTL